MSTQQWISQIYRPSALVQRACAAPVAILPLATPPRSWVNCLRKESGAPRMSLTTFSFIYSFCFRPWMTCSQTSLACWVSADWRTRQGPWFLPEESAHYFSIFIKKKKNLQGFTLLQNKHNCDSWFTIYLAGFTYFWQFYHVLDAAKYLFSTVKLGWWKSPCFLITDVLRSGFSTSALLTFWLR